VSILTEEFARSLTRLDEEIRAAALPVMRTLEAEIAALNDRLKAVRIIGNTELATYVQGEIDQRCTRLGALQELTKAPVVTAKTEIAKPTPVKAEPRPPAPVVPPVAVARRQRDLVESAPTVTPPKQKPEEPVAPATPKPRPAAPKPPLTRPQTIKAIQAFHARERDFLARSSWSDIREAELKSLVCEARALIELCGAHQFDDSNLWESFAILMNEFNYRTPEGSFFGFRRDRSHRYEIWHTLSEAYSLIGESNETLDWLEEHPQTGPDLEDLILGCAASEAWIHRIADEFGLGFVDDLQRQLHRRVEDFSEAIYVPWWKSSGDHYVRTEDVAKAARALPERFSALKKRVENYQKKESAMGALEELTRSIDEDGDLEQTLFPAIRQCLDAKIAPSDKRLVRAVLPYRAAIKEAEDPAFARLLDYLNREIALLLKQGELTEVEPTEPQDPDHELRLNAVKEYLAGKTMMFVGGRRIPEKAREVENVLGCKLIWPDAEPDTLMHDFAIPAMKSDIVCYLIRWSRHGYKNVIDYARANGKETVTLKAGIGLTRLVHDIYEQVILKARA
jgi:hypothetical protein